MRKKNEQHVPVRSPRFSRLDFYADGTVELLFFPLNDQKKPSCRNTLYTYLLAGTRPSVDAVTPKNSDSIFQAASNQYIATKRKEKWMGKNYRDVWAKPVKLPVFDIATEYGGLKIIKRGGGQQTHSIQVEDSAGHTYALRSLEKYVQGALPKNVHHTFAVDVVQGQYIRIQSLCSHAGCQAGRFSRGTAYQPQGRFCSL